MSEKRGRRSLARRMFLALILGQVAFTLTLGFTVATFSMVLTAKQRERTIVHVSATIAAGLMPMIADQQAPQVKAQLQSVITASEVEYVNAICVSDATGDRIACQGDWTRGLTTPRINPGPLSLLTQEQVVVEPVTVDGLKIASVKVRFSPPGLSALRTPAIATFIGLACSIAISVPWAAWRLVREVTEPLEHIGQYATRIAEGDFSQDEADYPNREIAALQDSIATMASQLKERDERLSQSFNELAGAYSSLETANHQIELLSAVKSNFVAVAAHELKGPLATIRIYTELLETGEMGELSEPATEAVEAISSASNRLVSIVSDLMDAALLERGVMRVDVGDLQLRPFIEDAVRDASVLAAGRQIAVRLEGGVPNTVARADRVRARQVIDNLLSNAIKYSPPSTTVTVAVQLEDEWLRIEVKDQGRGIPAGREGELFALFGRLDFGDSRDTAGLGLGLAISARIVEAHGGHLSYRSNDDGPGSTFTINVPLEAHPRSSYIAIGDEEANHRDRAV